ncbi:MAG: C26 family cysteine hydrolase domain-containing family [Rhodothermaceae bacterium]|nr:C26 family cysteine hydrolase domain-containing family [Rhodothermaceae bacterium]
MDRPRIGITTSLNKGEQRLDLRYVQAIERAGGLPVIVPMLEDEEATETFAALLDGLVVTGGPAITDGMIGALPDDIQPTAPIRLTSDRRILQAFLEQRRPTLGICYGMQLANALRGGTIYADVEAQRPHTSAHSQKREATDHSVHVADGTHLRRLLGTADLTVNTRHIQAIAEPGRGLRVTGTAPDGVIEALESQDGRFIGVQFHPERMGAEAEGLFQHLVAEARALASRSA